MPRPSGVGPARSDPEPEAKPVRPFGSDVATDRAELFGAEPSVGGDGTLRYTPARDAHGTATVTVRARDDGGTANGGNDTSGVKLFSITVRPVNDAPDFQGGADRSSAEDAGAQTVVGVGNAHLSRPGERSRTEGEVHCHQQQAVPFHVCRSAQDLGGRNADLRERARRKRHGRGDRARQGRRRDRRGRPGHQRGSRSA